VKRFIFTLCFVIVLMCGCTNQNNNTVVQQTSEISENIESVTIPEEKSSIDGKVIVIDAGHCIFKKGRQEKIAPDSDITKPAFVSGTSGVNQTEEELNLNLALKLQNELVKMGAVVHMTRTTHESDMSNIDRAEFANDLSADISVKIHADGNSDKNVRGISVLVPGDEHIKDTVLINTSREIGECILEDLIKSTGSPNRGISVRNDMTGFNWSKVPVVLLEVGFMSNPEEDALLETEEYQDKIITGIANGLQNYYNKSACN